MRARAEMRDVWCQTWFQVLLCVFKWVLVCVRSLFLSSFSSSRLKDVGMAAHSFFNCWKRLFFPPSLLVNTDLLIAWWRSDLCRLPSEFINREEEQALVYNMPFCISSQSRTHFLTSCLFLCLFLYPFQNPPLSPAWPLLSLSLSFAAGQRERNQRFHW